MPATSRWRSSCPSTELEAVMSGGQMSDILDRIAEHTRHHRTTLVFVNTRKMAERVAHQLAERLAEDEPGRDGDVDASLLVAAHHGSLSAARRRIVETRLRAGDLRALVATASLELGHRRRPGRAGLPDRIAPCHRHLPPARRPGQPPSRRDAGRPPLPDDARRARRVHRPARRRARGPARPAPAAGRPARRADPAARGGGGLHRRT